MAYFQPKTTEKRKPRVIVCQDCLEIFKPTEIYTVLAKDHYIFLCGPCTDARGTTGKIVKELKTKKAKS